jgi:cyclopropane fatty-acyl-phospholipid synthase-like methyltransferase
MLSRVNIRQAVTSFSTRSFISHPALDTLRKLLCKYRYLLFDVNTADYWDDFWMKEIASNYRRRLACMNDELISHPRMLLLDVGCGIGYLWKELDEPGATCTALIFPEERLACRAGMRKVVRSAHTVSSDSFDVVTSTQLLGIQESRRYFTGIFALQNPAAQFAFPS